MSFKPNPGCAMPEVQLPPSLEDFVTDIQKKVLAAKAAATLANATALVKAEAVRIDQLKQAAKLLAQAKKRADDIKKFEKLATKYSELQLRCPLPDVIDKKATGDTT